MNSISIQIIGKLFCNRMLHPALLDDDQENEHLRKIFERLLDPSLSVPFVVKSPLLKVLTREFLVCQVIQPGIEEFCR
jgi:hypothetical protein